MSGWGPTLLGSYCVLCFFILTSSPILYGRSWGPVLLAKVHDCPIVASHILVASRRNHWLPSLLWVRGGVWETPGDCFTGCEGPFLVCRRIQQKQGHEVGGYPAADLRVLVLALGGYRRVLCSHQVKGKGLSGRKGGFSLPAKGGPHSLSGAIPDHD